MVSKRLSPEYFKKCCETIFKHKWDQDFTYRSLFRKFAYVFDHEDIKEFNQLCDDFKEKYVFYPIDIDRHLNHMTNTNRIMRFKIDGDRFILTPELITKQLDDLLRWCHKKLNEYYKMYGITIDGLDASEIENLREFD